MALTAKAQSALPREPAWDEVIVPALRKRLKDESTLLARRISAASITSSEDHISQYYAASPVPSSSHSKPSAIPRPSLQQSRTADSSSIGHGGGHASTFQRARALSQPYAYNPLTSADTPTSEYSRSISPANVPKGTRIPVSRMRTGSTSSQAHSTHSVGAGRTNGRPNANGGGGELEGPPLSPVEERMQSNTSRSTVRVPRHKVSDIFNEQAPFVPHSLSSSQSNFDYGRQSPDRMSSESDEHPFEHWYRGDIARNGGVGELRVARRKEMLDIATYGHTLRKASGKHTPGVMSTRSRSSSRGRDANGRRRRRADSLGARESIYIDEEGVAQAGMVLDEQPLTDLEDDDYGDQDDEYYAEPVQPYANGSASSPSLDRSDTPTSRHTQNTSRSRIPQPSQRPSASPKSMAPSHPTRNASEPGTSSSSVRTASPKVPRSASQQKAASPSPTSGPAQQTPTAKRRAKSPATAASASVAKKAKAKSPPSSMQNRPTQKEENRRSIGQYPMPEGDEHAIPTWTQPVPANGNWDEVVLPAVAKKKGLDGHYRTADGSPKPRPPEEVIYEPAPGTFGYDATKYRRRQSGDPEQIQMDEFGQRNPPEQQLPVHNNQHGLTAQAPSPIPPLTPASFDRPNRAPSPPPFAHYAAQSEDGDPSVQTAQHLGAFPQSGKPQMVVEEESGGGCCKCVIM
ncbi:hypothetical protein BD413DRAFT_485126 [Trametes elegans]|nr:hypothetical protein BD413DRAFT_485126 [Trametes elegans]